jgi:predicted O-methyltransferase YrrM
MSYKFTSNYFGTCDLKDTLEKYIDKKKVWKILEIGSFEGSSATYFSDNMLDHPESSLLCVDPWISSDPTTPYTTSGYLTKQTFMENISKSKHFKKIKVIQQFSNDFFKVNKETFNFVYIDGSHLVEDIAHDFRESIKIVEPSGFIALDDYDSGSASVKKCIDQIYEENKDKLFLYGVRYQILFQVK